MALGGNLSSRIERIQVDQCLAYAGEQIEKVYEGIYGAMNLAKKSASIFSRNSTRSLSLQQTAVLKRSCLISHEQTTKVHFNIGEKLTIMFMYKNKFAVFRESDGTIAILSNAEFQGTPPAMLDGLKYGALLHDLEFILMYAVGKVEHCDVGGLRFSRNDVILILGHCNGTFVGITPRKKVGLFPSELVQPITTGRLCIFKGMVLKVNALVDCNTKKIYEGLAYEITKSSEGLFRWLTIDGNIISLHLVIEKSMSEPVRPRSLPETPQNNLQSNTNLQENPTDLDEEHLYVDILLSDEESQAEGRDTSHLQNDQGKQGERVQPPSAALKRQAFSTRVSTEKKHISDLKHQLKSITSSHNYDFFKSFSEEESEVQKRKELLEILRPFLQTEVNSQIFYAVAGYLEGELFHKVGHKLGVQENKRYQIEERKSDVVERTIELLTHWQQKEGQKATLERLIEALIEYDPRDMLFILEELCEEVTPSQDFQS